VEINHKRHCPKHRKPLPCAHCALTTAVIQPVTIPGFVPDMPCEFKLYDGVWFCVHCAHRVTDDGNGPPVHSCSGQARIKRLNKATRRKEIDKDQAEKDRRAERERHRRKTKTDQLAAIKLALKIPIADIKAAAKVKADGSRLPSMNQGKYMSDAPTGKGALVLQSGGKIDQIYAAICRAQALGSPTIDDETGEAFFADNDRDHWTPKGAGAPSDEKPEITGLSRGGFTYGDGEEKKKFIVDLNTYAYDQEFRELISTYIVKSESSHICRLCYFEIPNDTITAERIAFTHLYYAHGDPLNVKDTKFQHDGRFGDIFDRYQKALRKQEKKQAKLAKAGREKTLEAAADQKARAEIGATKAGYIKLNGEWIRPAD
jgi:hypothetical protein